MAVPSYADLIVGLDARTGLDLLAHYSEGLPECTADLSLSFSQRLQHYRSLPQLRAQVLAHLSEPAPAGLEEALQQARKHLLQSGPLAYLLGFADFAGYSFAVGPGVLVPREDSEILLQASRSRAEECGTGQVLELCCGTACISLAWALDAGTSLQFAASDISLQALRYARVNRDYWQAGVSLYQSDLFAELPTQSYQIVLANPPYLSEREYRRRSGCCEPRLALSAGLDGLALLRRIIGESRHHLCRGGFLLLEAAPWQIHELGNLLEMYKFSDIQLERDAAGLLRVISAQYWG